VTRPVPSPVFWSAIDELQAQVERARSDPLAPPAPPGPDAYADVRRYRAWLDDRQRRHLDDPPAPTPAVPIAVVIDARSAPWTERCLRSVRGQSQRPHSVSTVGHAPSGGEPQPRAGGARWVALVRGCDELADGALAHVAAAVVDRPDVDLVYSDEDHRDEDGGRSRPVFKPDWSPELLESCPYLGHLLVVRVDLLEEVGGLWSESDDPDGPARGPGVDAYDLMLRTTERARHVLHVPRTLVHRGGPDAGWFIGEPVTVEAGRRALTRALTRRRERADIDDGPWPGTFHVRHRLERVPSVSIVIPFRDQPALLRTCVDSLVEAPGHDEFEIVLVDNASTEPETAALLEQLAARPGHVVLDHPGEFNWSAINNRAVEACRGELLLFLNNDVEARRPGWMRAMVEHAVRPGVGAVGARLLYPNGTVQHVGTVLGLGAVAAHMMPELPASEPGYLGFATLTRNWSAVTAACLLCRRDVFASVGGFDEELAVAFNDVDFCLRLADAGHRIVFTPNAELIHHESITRGLTGFSRDYGLFVDRWYDRLQAGDPFFSPNLSRIEWRCPVVRPADEDAQWEANLSTLMASSRS
jgi:O-antigen biosynthesis protein